MSRPNFTLACLSLGLAFVAGEATAQTSFYQDKTLTIYSGNSAGGAYSAYARLLEHHIAKHIPGQPTTVLKFMDGAAGLTFANWLYNIGPKDGTAFGIFPQRMAIEPLVAPHAAIKFDGRKFTWLGSLAKQAGVCFTWHTSKTRSVEDARKQTTIVGSSGATSADSVMPRIMNSVLGTKFQVVGGYGGADILLAMERGEIEGRCGFGWASVKTTRPEWIQEKKINVIAQFSLKPHPELPNVPLLIDLVDDSRDRRALQLFFSPEEMGRPFAAPPDIPQERTTILREAFMKAAADPALLADAAKMKLEIEPITGAAVQAILDDLYTAPADIAKRVAEFRNLGSDSKKGEKKP